MTKLHAVLPVVVAAIVPLWLAAPASLGQAAPDKQDPSVSPTPAEPVPTKIKEPPTDRISTELSFGGSFTAPSDLEDDRGHVAITRAGLDLSLYIPYAPAADKLLFTVGLTNEFSWYTFGGADHGVTAGTDKPVSDVTLLRITPAFRYKVDSDWTLFGGLVGEAAGQNDVELGQTTTGGGFLGAKYKLSDNLSVSLGIAAKTQLEDDALVLPLVGFDWNITDKLDLTLEGASLTLTYEASPTWDLGAQLSYEDRNFRLAKDAPIPYGVLRDQRVTVGLQAQWNPTVWFSLKGEVGVVAWSQLEFDTSSGNPIDTLDVDPTGYAGISATFRF